MRKLLLLLGLLTIVSNSFAHHGEDKTHYHHGHHDHDHDDDDDFWAEALFLSLSSSLEASTEDDDDEYDNVMIKAKSDVRAMMAGQKPSKLLQDTVKLMKEDEKNKGKTDKELIKMIINHVK